MLASILLFTSILFGDTIKPSPSNYNFIELFNRDYCTTYAPPLHDTTLYYTLIPESQDVAVYFSYSTPGCVGGISIEDILLKDTLGGIIYTGLIYNSLNIGYPYQLQLNIKLAGACLGIDNFCPYYININSLAVELCDYKLYFQDNVKCEFIICSSNATRRFLVDRSLDLYSWVRVTEIEADAYSSFAKSYYFEDMNYYEGVSYYRVIEEDLNGVKTEVFIDYVGAPNRSKSIYYYDLAGRLIKIK
jgi:hypothetical protein